MNNMNIVQQLVGQNNFVYGATKSSLISVNLHITKACNFKCKFCYAQFNQLSNKTSEIEWKQIIDKLADYGTEKITFVGGEPTLVSFLPELVKYTKNLGLTTMIVTNGSKITKKYLLEFENSLDWIGLSIDTSKERISLQLGRGSGNHVKHTIKVADLLHKNGVRIKLNTVVNKLNYHENMTQLINRIKPDRWKVFQMLPIEGENDEAADLLVTEDEFRSFIDINRNGNPIAENNEAMTDSYIMIDPEGRFFNNTDGQLSHGSRILEVGLIEAFNNSNFNFDKLIERKGIYKWK